MDDRRSEGHSVYLLATTGILSALYFLLAVRFALRIGSSDLNSSARGFFLSVLVSTIVLYSVSLLVAITQRHNAAAPVPVCLAAMFGAFVCVVFFGP